MTAPTPRTASQNTRRLLAIGSLAVAALAAALPVLWVAGILAVGLATVILSGKERWLVAVLGGALVVVSCVRFAREYAKPNLAKDAPEAEKIAISRLREIYWAQSQAREFKLVDANHDGTGEYLSLPELIGEQTARLNGRPPLLKPGLFVAVDKDRGIYASERYFYVVYLPGTDGTPTTQAKDADPVASSRSFAAYAWPVDSQRGEHRAFYIDQFEQICDTPNQEGFYGPEHVPQPSAYALNASGGVSHCGQDEETGGWRPWRARKDGPVKEPRATR